MNIWIVNPFDPLPGDPEQEGRYATLARLLCGRGHRIVWWTSIFSHRFKRLVDAATIRRACETIGIKPIFLPSPAYTQNVSVRRLWNHRVLARRFAEAATREADSPHVVLASSPPPGLARAAVEIAHARCASAIVDIQDLWPDTFHRLAPSWARPATRWLLSPMQRDACKAYSHADALVGVADAYVQRAIELGGSKSAAATIPLGVDLQGFDAAARQGASERWTRPPGEVWLAYTGSLNRSYDFLTIIRAAARIRESHGERVRFILTGRGDLVGEAQRLVREQRLSNVTLTGFLDFNTWAYLLTQCDVGFNASFPEALIYLPNKVFYYFAAGLAVLNTIPGQCSEMISGAECGLDYRAGNVESCVRVIERIMEDASGRAAMGGAARKLAEREYDRRVLFPRYAEFVESLVSPGGRAVPGNASHGV